jgi:hypothetical protein
LLGGFSPAAELQISMMIAHDGVLLDAAWLGVAAFFVYKVGPRVEIGAGFGGLSIHGFHR